MILLTGGTGQLGTAIAPSLAALDEVAAPGRDVLDLSRPARLHGALDHLAPEVIVNTAAWTDVDAAEDHEVAATRINGEAVRAMASWAADNGAWLVTVSTDYVFDGSGTSPLTEDRAAHPVNAYGRSKLVGERAALASGSALVVRTAWLVSGTHANFVATMLSLLERGVDPTVVDDQTGSPTIATDLAAAIAGLVRLRPTGLLHLVNQGTTTWWGLARAVAEQAGHDPRRVRPCTTAEYPTRAARPAWSVLASSRLEELGLQPLPHWRDSLPAVVAAQRRRLAT